jgi:hypothetical protein
MFFGAIPYRDIFMTDIFATAAADVDLVATLLASRVQDEKISPGVDSRARRKQEPAGSDYL